MTAWKVETTLPVSAFYLLAREVAVAVFLPQPVKYLTMQQQQQQQQQQPRRYDVIDQHDVGARRTTSTSVAPPMS